MATILGVSGSLRRGSLNAMLLANAARLAPEGTRVEIGSIKGIPLYDGDVEAASGVPEGAQRLKEQFIAADGVLLVTPEYNNGIPGVFKNAIDWLSRPPADVPKVFGDRPMAVIGASPGGFGTILAQEAWLPVLRTLRVRVWFGGRLMVSRAGGAFDETGNLNDEATRTQLRQFMAGFSEFIGR